MAELTVGMATLAKFYTSTPAAQVRVVRDFRTYFTDRKTYIARNYYGELLNVFRREHWLRGDISQLPAAVDQIVEAQKDPNKRQHYREISDSYLTGWHSRATEWFKPARSQLEVADLQIRITPEVGMYIGTDAYVLKLWLNAPKPKRLYRQAVQYLMDTGRSPSWPGYAKTGIWDVRRDEILPTVSLPRDFLLSLEGAARSFQQMLTSLAAEAGRIAPTEEEEEDNLDIA